jgi:hypothetical protein
MKKIIALLGAASLLTLSSCDLAMLGEGTMGRRDTQRIERGMSQEQVYSLMGRPTYRRFGDNGIEEWEYHKSGLFEKRITVISFSSGRVVRMNTYNGDYNDSDRGRYPSQRGNYPYGNGDYGGYGGNGGYGRYGDYDDYGDYRSDRQNDQWFSQVYHEVQRQTFTDDKIRYIRDVARRNRFTTQQTIKLLRLFSFDEEKLKVLACVASGLRDPRNSYRIVDQFSFSSSQQEARRLLGII